MFQGHATQRNSFPQGYSKNIRTLFPLNLRPGILVLDHLMRDCGEDQHVLDLFTKGSHHNDVTCIYLTQNLFPPGKYARAISLNTHYVVAFKNPRDAVGVRNMAQQAYPGRVAYVMEDVRAPLDRLFWPV